MNHPVNISRWRRLLQSAVSLFCTAVDNARLNFAFTDVQYYFVEYAHCFDSNCYPLAFGTPTILMAFSLGL